MASPSADEAGAGAARAGRSTSRPRANPGWGLVVVGGLLGVLGAFLTWATVNYGGVATHTYRGVSAGRDGKITLVLAVLVLALTAAAFLGWVGNWLRPALTILGLVLAFVALADLVASPSVGSEEQARLRTPVHVTSSNGIGEWLTLIAGILVVIGVVLAARYSRPASVGAHTARAAARSDAPPSGQTVREASSQEPAAVSALSTEETAEETPATDEPPAATPAAAPVPFRAADLPSRPETDPTDAD